ncbi:MAG: class I SAM-dependent methyltransferase [Chloroflexi bacterium]|nr:class I SAM-dependent methyltransferase [Chloroflexota bacterium]MCY4248389.1 class I SAM-dependent methyltransferase [Chloroflexota bacterium]
MTDYGPIRAFYRSQARLYQRLVARQDHRGELLAALNEIVALAGLLVVEFGAGTGNLTSKLVGAAARVHAFDLEPSMLALARPQLLASGSASWSLAAADNGRMPVASNCADLAIEAWSFVYVLDWQPDDWRKLVDQLLAEMQRVVKPGGIAILVEDLGIGRCQPAAPTADMARLYAHWQERHRFQCSWIRTDYQFASPVEADELARLFFGDDLLERRLRPHDLTLPECTGIWWKRF